MSTRTLVPSSNREGTAGDTSSAVSRRIGHHVIRPCMDDHRSAVSIQPRIASTRKILARYGNFHAATSITADQQIGQIPTMHTLRIVLAMLFLHGFSLPAHVWEHRRLAITCNVDR